MRTTTAVRLGAAFTASALALSLGAGTALAEGDTTDSQSAHLKSISSTAGTAKKLPAGKAQAGKTTLGKASASVAELPPESDITSFSQKSIVLNEPGTFIYEGAPVVTNPDGIGFINTRVTVGTTQNGRELAFPGAVFGDPDYPTYPGYGIVLPSTTAVGKAHLGPSNIYYQYPDHTPTNTSTLDDTIGGTFYIRRYTKSTATYGFEIYRSGSKIKFKANSWKIFKPSTGTYVGMPSIKLQYRHSNGSYSTLKTISLNTYGSGSYTKTTTTKRRYRLLISTTDTIWGSKTSTSGRI